MDQPQHLIIFDEASGTTCASYGTEAGGYTATAFGGSPDYSRSATGGPYSGGGYFTANADDGTTMPYLTTAVTTPGTTFNAINFAVGFRISSFSNGQGVLIGQSGGYGGCKVWCSDLSGGTFTLNAYFNGNVIGTASQTVQWTGLATDTDHIISGFADVSTPSAGITRYKCNSQAVSTPTDTDWAAGGDNQWENAWPRLLRRSDTSVYYGIVGRLNLFVYQRGGTVWTTTDLANINADPTVIEGWPSSGAHGSPMGGPFGRLLRGKL